MPAPCLEDSCQILILEKLNQIRPCGKVVCSSNSTASLIFKCIGSATHESSQFASFSSTSGSKQAPKGRTPFVVAKYIFTASILTDLQLCIHSPNLLGPQTLWVFVPCYHFGSAEVEYCCILSKYKSCRFVILELTSLTSHKAEYWKSLLLVFSPHGIKTHRSLVVLCSCW